MPLVLRIGLVHQRLDNAREGVGRRVRARLWFGKDGAQGLSHPVIASGAVMLIVRVAVHEELGEAATASVHEQRSIRRKVAADHVGNLHERALLELHLVDLVFPGCAAGFVGKMTDYRGNAVHTRPWGHWPEPTIVRILQYPGLVAPCFAG